MDYGHRLAFVKLMTANSFLHLHHNATATTLHTVGSSQEWTYIKLTTDVVFYVLKLSVAEILNF